jgi:small subunit ribosomal protein S7
MPRRREVPKREILADPKFHNTDVAKFINVLMTRGKKSVAERIVYGAFNVIKSKAGKDPVEVFTQAVQNVKPVVEWAARTTRSRWRCDRCVASRWQCAGFARRLRSAARSR